MADCGSVVRRAVVDNQDVDNNFALAKRALNALLKVVPIIEARNENLDRGHANTFSRSAVGLECRARLTLARE
jgi:FKBP-type peptidyl-prolyl cis-trans isomerase 2